MARFVTVGGLSGVGVLVVGAILPELIDTLPEWVRYSLLGIGAALILTSWVWWMLNRGERGSGGTTQTTRGSNSPNFGTVHGNVTFHSPPAATQPAKSAHGSARYTSDNLAGLDRVMRGSTSKRPLEPEVARILREQRDRCPEMPIWKALHEIASQIGDTDKASGFPEARRQFRQAALEGRIDAWGQRQIPPRHMQDNRHRDVWSPIDADHWEDHALHQRAASKAALEQPHTEEEEIGRRSGRYWNLKVRPEDIKRRWPQQLRTTNDGKP